MKKVSWQHTHKYRNISTFFVTVLVLKMGYPRCEHVQASPPSQKHQNELSSKW